MIVVRRLQVPCLLGCRYLVYSAAASGESGKIHNNVRARWEAGETEAVDSMLKFARAAALSSMPHGAACAVYPTSGHGQTSEASPNQISKHQASLTKEASPPKEPRQPTSKHQARLAHCFWHWWGHRHEVSGRGGAGRPP